MSTRLPPAFADVWCRAVDTHADQTFLRFEDAHERVTSWTYGEFDRLVARVARGLASRGASAEGPVHLALANSPAFVAVWLAAVRLGAPMVPSDPKASASELRGHIERTAPAVGVYAHERGEVYRLAVSESMTTVALDESDTILDVLVSGGGEPTTGPPRPSDRAAIIFTSGTTSAPKGVVVTQANYAFAGEVMAEAASMDAGDRALVVLPLFHANAQYYSFAAAITAGASVVLTSRFSATRMLKQAARHRATHASLFAAPMRMMLAKRVAPVAGVRLRHVWYAQDVTAEQYEQLAGLFGCEPRQLYGMTETMPAVLTDRRARPVPGTLGTASPRCAVDIWLDPGRSTREGEEGQIVVDGTPGVTLFDGYLDDPETTIASFSDGWFLTGDRARRDPNGEIRFAGRSSDVLKVAGENVSAVEVELVVTSHPAVLEAAVVGRPDATLDEVPVAFVVRDPARGRLVVDELARYCDERLAPSKRPRAIHVVEELPRTSVGKIQKFRLRELA